MNTVWTAHFPQLHRGVRITILLVLALSIAPAAPAQKMGFTEGLSGTLQSDTGKPVSTVAGSLSERTANHPLVPKDILEPFPQPAPSNHVSAVGGLGARQGAPARRIADEMHPRAAVTLSLSASAHRFRNRSRGRERIRSGARLTGRLRWAALLGGESDRRGGPRRRGGGGRRSCRQRDVPGPQVK